jgi:hypothetical protein
MPEVERIEIDEARRRIARDNAVLVCAYEDEARCKSLRLPGALTMSEFRAVAKALPRDHPVIFYCA